MTLQEAIASGFRFGRPMKEPFQWYRVSFGGYIMTDTYKDSKRADFKTSDLMATDWVIECESAPKKKFTISRLWKRK